MDPEFFADAEELRAWLRRNHATRDECWIGLHRKGTGRPSVTWSQLVDELICFGWIDGLRRSLDDERWAIRVTPRREGSRWSPRNVRRARALIEDGRMEPPGLRAFAAADLEETRRSSAVREDAELGEEFEAEFRAHEAAWAFWRSESPSYRRTATAWVVTAKREATRRRRLATLIRDSANGRRIGPLRR
ncbi:MAG: YdeI/OmpD-associated family protein [Gemmatimonadota bacterium]